MSKQVDEFFVIFDEVYDAFKERDLTIDVATLDVIEKIAVHLSMNITRSQSGGPAGGVPDGQEGTAEGNLEATAKRTVSTQKGERTAFDITVSGQKYSTFDKK